MVSVPAKKGSHNFTIFIKLIVRGRAIRVFSDNIIHRIVPPCCTLRQPISIINHSLSTYRISILKKYLKTFKRLFIIGVTIFIITTIIFKDIFLNMIILMIWMRKCIYGTSHFNTHGGLNDVINSSI